MAPWCRLDQETVGGFQGGSRNALNALNVKRRGQETGDGFAYSVVSGVGIASEVDQPHVVALLGHHEAEAVVGEDSLGRGGLVAVEV